MALRALATGAAPPALSARASSKASVTLFVAMPAVMVMVGLIFSAAENAFTPASRLSSPSTYRTPMCRYVRASIGSPSRSFLAIFSASCSFAFIFLKSPAP